MVNRRRRTRKNAEGDESVGLSGWLYTDLMLGLAVVFLGAIVIKIPALVKDDEGEIVVASTTSTTTIPPVDLCTALYAPDGEREQSLLVKVRKDADAETMKREFKEGLQVLYDSLNSRPFFRTNGIVLDINSTKIGLILAQAGWNGVGSGTQKDATKMRASLSILLPDILEGTPGRDTYGRNVDSSIVQMEILPLIELPCGAS